MNPENDIIIGGADSGGGGKPRIPKEAPEGIVTGNIRTLSKTQIETIDLLSEGEIHWLCTGEYQYSGVLGSIGWSGVIFKPNAIAIGTNKRWLQSVFWNETPVVDKDGKFNFQQVSISGSKGSPNGSRISDGILDELTNTRLISERLRAGEQFSKIYRILDKNCIGSEVNIRVNQLSKTSTSKKKLGDILPSEIEYTIYYRPVFSNRSGGDFIIGKKEKIVGKISAGLIQSTRILFNSDNSNDNNFLGWEIKITRWTEESTTSTVRNQSFIDSLTEIYGAKFIYPNSAIISSTFDSEYFSNIPSRTYLSRGLKVKVPNNYNPIYKTYDESSPWDGTFKEYTSGPLAGKILKEWTDNPVWCYYDILTNKRYGLGKYIDEESIDKFTLYEISKYCDTLVSDGYGGLEPRFTCNAYIVSQEEAYDMVNSMASIFRGITYYSAGQIYTSQDSEKHPIYQFTNANVINGDFTYSSSAKKARHTIAIVRYNDKKNFYKPAIEYVENIDAIRKYGLRDVDVPAFGCTSRGQAIRLGRWALLTESLETESVNFQSSIDVAGLIRPGDVFQIYDSNRKTQRLGGRLSNIIVSPTSTNVTLDSEITGLNSATTYKFALLTPSYYYDTSLVTDLNSNDISGLRRSQIQYFTFNTTNTSTIDNKTNITVNTGIDYTNYNVSGNLVWLIEATGNNIFGNIKSNEWDTYRVVNINEVNPYTYEIQGLQYEIDKFIQIESGFSFTDSFIGPELQFSSPTGLKLELRNPPPSINSELIDYSFSISDLNNIKGFRVFSKAGADDSTFLAGDISSGNYIIAELSKTTMTGSYFPSENGKYNFRVYSLGTNNLLSNNYASNSINITNINPLQDIIISSLQLSREEPLTNAAGTQSYEIYSTEEPEFDWQVGIGGISNIPTDFSYRITARSPSSTNKPSQEIYYEVSGYLSPDTTYIFPFTGNYTTISRPNNLRGPFREYDLVVEAMNSGGFSSAGGNFGNVTTHDSDYSNPNGYDILHVNNPPPQAQHLFTGLSTHPFYQTGHATQQWITPDGEIKMFFSVSGQIVPISGFFGDDIVGGILYYSNSPFSPEEAKNQIPINPPDKIINRVQVTTDDNPIVAPLGLYNVFKQYIALAPYDSFDNGITTFNTGHLSTGLNLSNVIEIKKQFSSQVYRAWVQFDITTDNVLLNTWRERSFNIGQINDTIYSIDDREYDALEIVFEDPMPSPYYGINLTYHRFNPRVLRPFPPLNAPPGDYGVTYNVPVIYNYDEHSIILPSPSKLLDHVVVGQGSTGRFFLGVISNN